MIKMHKALVLAKILEFLLLLSLLLFIIFSPFSKVLGKMAFVNGMFFCFFIICLKFINKDKKANIPTLRQMYSYFLNRASLRRYFLIFFAACIISVIFSLNPYHSQKILFGRYLPYMLFVLLGCYLVKSKRYPFLLFYAFFLGGIVLAIGGWWDYLYSHVGRLFSSFGIRVNLSPYLAMYTPFNYAVVLFAKNKILKLIGLLTFILILFCLFWHGSRSALLAVAFTIFLVTFLKNKIAGLCLIILCAIAIFLLPLPMFKNSGEFLKSVSWNNRLDLWKTALGIFEDFPIFGAGLGMYEKILYRYAPAGGYSEAFIHLHSHNTYLEIASEIGIIGIAAFLGIFIAFFRKAFAMFTIKKERYFSNRETSILGFTMAIFAVMLLAFSSSVITVGLQDAAMFWFIIGMAAGLLDMEPSRTTFQKDVTA